MLGGAEFVVVYCCLWLCLARGFCLVVFCCLLLCVVVIFESRGHKEKKIAAAAKKNCFGRDFRLLRFVA